MISANLSNTQRKAIYRRDGYRCALCDCAQSIQIHHAIPRGQGGDPTNPMNLITLCRRCHAQAHGLDLDGTGLTDADIQQACVEYLADYYAPNWWPWRKGYHPLE